MKDVSIYKEKQSHGILVALPLGILGIKSKVWKTTGIINLTPYSGRGGGPFLPAAEILFNNFKKNEAIVTKLFRHIL